MLLVIELRLLFEFVRHSHLPYQKVLACLYIRQLAAVQVGEAWLQRG